MSGAGPRAISNVVKWTICAVAAMGFLFDIYVVLVGPLILQPALTELGHLKAGTPEYRDWAGYLFWIPPLVGGFCGLWGGVLAGRFGRRRILTYSVLVYAFSATASSATHRAGLHGAGRPRLCGLTNSERGPLLGAMLELGLLLPFIHLGDWITWAGVQPIEGWLSLLRGK